MTSNAPTMTAIALDDETSSLSRRHSPVNFLFGRPPWEQEKECVGEPYVEWVWSRANSSGQQPITGFVHEGHSRIPLYLTRHPPCLADLKVAGGQPDNKTATYSRPATRSWWPSAIATPEGPVNPIPFSTRATASPHLPTQFRPFHRQVAEPHNEDQRLGLHVLLRPPRIHAQPPPTRDATVPYARLCLDESLLLD